ncbi:polyphosphate kinase 1 [Mucilaginibacter robiniae]|uniref:Polyphosphate kinase n=1 Tax=Mucilaginibacter robiniae TaxID=2728022 RepID=A0A7L5E105_9SPHI|nr:polyphosphate kinase 1 [Mucilaginibacter robiniae]QJD97042.1 polyphosphate kinase 1 [Mucilaginibacter robiniae]
MQPYYFNRDLSWLSFNGRILQEAARNTVPVLERINFLSIYSSNLDEFYRVRMPVLQALQNLHDKDNDQQEAAARQNELEQAQQLIQQQLNEYGRILTTELLPLLQQNHVQLLYNVPLPEAVQQLAADYFYSQVMAFLQPVFLSATSSFFPENNKLYLLTLLQDNAGQEQYAVVNIPSDELPRFFSVTIEEQQYLIFLDDLVRCHLDKIFPQHEVRGSYSFKVNRDAELDFKDEYTDNLADRLEQQIKKRDLGLATRFLYEPSLPLRALYRLSEFLNLQSNSAVAGGRYHNLRDLASLPIENKALSYPKWSPIRIDALAREASLLDTLDKQDFILHTPYNSYNQILRFFNEAALRPDVVEINVTLYRVASDSKIVNALMSAAKSGKQVNVVVELKARFDEANNLKWAKKLKAAGAKMIYSATALKVHAKTALVKIKQGNRTHYRGLLATGNFNENTARFYTDHILLTANESLLREMELLFLFLAKKRKPETPDLIPFQHLLVAQFNLQQQFIALIDQEIASAQQGQPAYIHIKLNNLEEERLINKLYEASQAGVRIRMIVRSICRLVPGIPGMSENITVTRIVDRYLEHGRVFVFGNQGNPKVYLGSADWMNRNIYHRIEVCFPVYDEHIRQQMLQLMDIQLHDNVQAVRIDEHLNNIPVKTDGLPIRSQQEIYQQLTKQ